MPAKSGTFWLVWCMTVADKDPAHAIFLKKVGKPSALFPGHMLGQAWTADPAHAHKFPSAEAANRAANGDHVQKFESASAYALRSWVSLEAPKIAARALASTDDPDLEAALHDEEQGEQATDNLRERPLDDVLAEADGGQPGWVPSWQVR